MFEGGEKERNGTTLKCMLREDALLKELMNLVNVQCHVLLKMSGDIVIKGLISDKTFLFDVYFPVL